MRSIVNDLSFLSVWGPKPRGSSCRLRTSPESGAPAGFPRSDKKNPPYWAFEKGVYLEKFDSLFHIDASIKADTAYYYEKKKLWELRSNVHIRSQRGDKFDTDLLFWDEKQERVYSDKFIRIEQEDKIITGYGFESNQQMTEYQIYNNTGIFTVEDTAPADSTKAVANSTRTDSIR